METFLSQTEQQITEKALLIYYQTQPFYDFLFSGYLFNSEDIFMEPTTKIYYSQLFDQLPVEMYIKPKIIHETPQVAIIKHTASHTETLPNLTQIEEIYNTRYRPQIGYKFSDYIYEHSSEYTVNTETHLLENATMQIHEAVKNNIEIIVDYKLRRIES